MTYHKLWSTFWHSAWGVGLVLLTLPFKLAQDLSYWSHRGLSFMVRSADSAVTTLESK